MRDSAIMYRSFYESGQCLPEAERLKLYEAIFEYSFNGKVVELDGIAKPILMLIMPLLEANMKRYENGKKAKKKQSGSKAGAKDKQDRSKRGANKDVNKDVNENENENENILEGFFQTSFYPSWKEWVDYKKTQHRFKFKSIDTERKAVKLLHEMSNGDEVRALKIIEFTMAQGYQGLVSVKEDPHQQAQDLKPKASETIHKDNKW